MSDWIHALPIGWMAVLVIGSTWLIAAAIHWLVQRLAKGERGSSRRSHPECCRRSA